MTTETAFFVVPAPGRYGDRAKVVSSHRTLAAAKKAATPGWVARVGNLRKGSPWLRSDEPFYPVA